MVASIHFVGSSQVHQELWIPAENLSEFNQCILGKIEIVAAYYGESFSKEIDPNNNLPIEIKLPK
jgi:hypothetical protein